MNRAQYTIAASVQHCRRTSIANVVSGVDGGMAIDHMIPRKVSDWTIFEARSTIVTVVTKSVSAYPHIDCIYIGVPSPIVGGFLGEWVCSLDPLVMRRLGNVHSGLVPSTFCHFVYVQFVTQFRWGNVGREVW